MLVGHVLQPRIASLYGLHRAAIQSVENFPDGLQIAALCPLQQFLDDHAQTASPRPLSTFRFTPISGRSRGTSARLKRANFGSPGRLTLDVFEVADAYHATSSNIRIHNNVVVVRKLQPEKNDFYANGAHGDGERLCFMRGS